ALLCSWWRATVYGERARPPWVVFVCQDVQSLVSFAEGASHAVTGRVDHEGRPGRERTLFVLEADIHRGSRRAWRLPAERGGESCRSPENCPVDRMTERSNFMVMAAKARKKTTVYLDPDLLTAAKVLAASTGKRDYEVMEDALRHYLGAEETAGSREALQALLERIGKRSDLDESAAEDLAYSELKAARRSRRR
ncbi:MAG TPA: hypothetical protein VE570_11535, partial [Thermoleophilaceae bacterium]|nr:hypothetical protein [Thermoleophilaceae bacterium]